MRLCIYVYESCDAEKYKLGSTSIFGRLLCWERAHSRTAMKETRGKLKQRKQRNERATRRPRERVCCWCEIEKSDIDIQSYNSVGTCNEGCANDSSHADAGLSTYSGSSGLCLWAGGSSRHPTGGCSCIMYSEIRVVLGEIPIARKCMWNTITDDCPTSESYFRSKGSVNTRKGGRCGSKDLL